MTTLSVIVPMRNVEPFIDDLLLSLSRNVRDDFEFIAVDDGSRDRTPEILDDHQNRIRGLKVIHNDSPTGLSAARNTGLAASSGRLITYLDGDDWIAPGYLASLVSAIDEIGCEFVRVDHVQVYGQRRVMHRAPQRRRGVILTPRDSILPVHDNSMVDYPYAWAGVYRRELADAGLLTFESRLLTAEDRPWIWRLHRQASSYAVVSLAGLFYRRQVATSLTQTGDERQLHFFDAFDAVLAGLEDDPDRDRLYPKAVRTYCALIAHHLVEHERLTPAVSRRLRARAKTTIRALPTDLLTQIRPGLGPEREELFTRMLGIEVGR